MNLHNTFTLDPQIIDDILTELRWIPYPVAVKEAFSHIDKLYFKVKSQKKNWKPLEVRPIMDQFIFNTSRLVTSNPEHEDDGRGMIYRIFRPLWELNPIRVLEIADLLLRSISSAKEESDRQCLFDTYFYNRTSQDEDFMLALLCLTTQLAAGAQNAQFLKCCASWMRETGLDSFAVSYIAKEIVKELSSVDISDKYSKLPEFAPEFAASIVMAIARAYRDKDRPQSLLNHMSVWIEFYPTICFMPPHSSIFELFRWSMFWVQPEPRLHAALLSAIHRAGKGAQLQVIPHIMQIIQEFKHHRDMYCQKHGLTSLSRRYLRNKRKLDLKAGVEKTTIVINYEKHQLKRRTFKIQICRLFQIIQMLISSECLDENEIQPIFQAYEGALEFKFNFYMQLKTMYGIPEDSNGMEDSQLSLQSQNQTPNFHPRKQLAGKYSSHLRDKPGKNKTHKSPSKSKANGEKISSDDGSGSFDDDSDENDMYDLQPKHYGSSKKDTVSEVQKAESEKVDKMDTS